MSDRVNLVRTFIECCIRLGETEDVWLRIFAVPDSCGYLEVSCQSSKEIRVRMFDHDTTYRGAMTLPVEQAAHHIVSMDPDLSHIQHGGRIISIE